MTANQTTLAYLPTIISFILALKFLSSPKHARLGNQLGAVGMALAIVVTIAAEGRSRRAQHDRLHHHRRRRPDRRADRLVRRAPGEDDRHAADGGAVQRRRRRRGGPGRAGRVSREGRPAGTHHLERIGRNRHLGADRKHLLRRQHDRLRQAAGPGRRPPDRLARPEDRQHPDPPDRHHGGSGHSRRPPLSADLAAPDRDRGRARLRRPLRAADRRRRHAGRDRSAQRLHRPLRLGSRLRAAPGRPDRERHARRLLGFAADAADVPGDEPLAHQRHLRRLRPDPGRRPGGRLEPRA